MIRFVYLFPLFLFFFSAGLFDIVESSGINHVTFVILWIARRGGDGRAALVVPARALPSKWRRRVRWRPAGVGRDRYGKAETRL